MSTQLPRIVFDVIKLQEACHRLEQKPANVDTLDWIAREATGIPTLILSFEERQMIKPLMHGAMYGQGPQHFFDALKRKK